MSPDPAQIFAVLLFAIAAFAGARATFRVIRRYRAVSRVVQPLYRLILFAFVVVCVVITSTAFLLGLLSTRRLLGFESLDWAAPFTWAASIAVLFLPTFIDRVLLIVERGKLPDWLTGFLKRGDHA